MLALEWSACAMGFVIICFMLSTACSIYSEVGICSLTDLVQAHQRVVWWPLTTLLGNLLNPAPNHTYRTLSVLDQWALVCICNWNQHPINSYRLNIPYNSLDSLGHRDTKESVWYEAKRSNQRSPCHAKRKSSKTYLSKSGLRNKAFASAYPPSLGSMGPGPVCLNCLLLRTFIICNMCPPK